MNLACIVFGIAFIIHSAYTPAWDVFGILLLGTLFGDFALVHILDRAVDKSTPQGKRLNRISYAMLLVVSICMLGIMAGNFGISITYVDAPMENLYAIIYASFFGMLAVGGLFTFYAARSVLGSLARSNGTRHGPPEQHMPRDTRRGTRAAVVMVCSIVLGVMVYFAILSVAGSSLGISSLGDEAGAINGLAGLASGMFGGFWCFITLNDTLFILKVTRRYQRPRFSLVVGLMGLVVSCILFIPVVATPASIASDDASFVAAFGDWHAKIPAIVDAYFLPEQITIPGYYLGIPPKNCIIVKDVLYYMGTTGAERNLKLHFDAYLPPNHGLGLPGGNSTVIRIHGGAWVIGDKSMAGMMQVDEYLAAQGYCVFDIQYGLSNSSVAIFSSLGATTPTYVMGNFSVDDMLHQIGHFCQYLTSNQAEYGANLSSTFISGGSAGGQLACATALAIANGSFSSYFGTRLTIRGLAPMYPANTLANPIDNGRTRPEFLDPTLLVNATSPPCLIYQGTQDGLVNPKKTQAFKDAYANAGNPHCAIIWLPNAGHGSDLYFSGYYNTLFLYYIERFMYMFK